jgi:hypothetical protein
MKPESKRLVGLASKPPVEPDVELREYPLIEAREYPAYCKWAKQYWDPGFHRWMCLLRWDVLTDNLLKVIATVPQWLPLGNREKPHASRRGKYLREWVRANGRPPVRGDRLSPRIFVRRMARIEVGDTDPERSPAPYSVVRKVLAWETGWGTGHSISKSHSQGRQGLSVAQREPCKE